MALREDLESSGTWLFKKRSYLPILVIVPVLWSLRNFQYLGGSAGTQRIWDLFCLLVGVLGVLVRCYTVGHVAQGTSGRTTRAPTADTLNVTGMYSMVRHPLYLGNYLMWLGPAMMPHSVATALIVSLIFWIYYERIMLAEESYLRTRFGATFEAWAARTPAFLPRFSSFVPPERPFSLHNVLKREAPSLLALILMMTVIAFVSDFVATGHLVLDPLWIALLVPAVALYLVMRISRQIRRSRERARDQLGGGTI